MSSALPALESFSGLSAFAATVDAGGFAAAGRRMGISASAVGKAVARLEARVGVRLLNRTTRQVTMTFEGEQLYGRASRLLDDLRDIESLLATQRATPLGRVRATLPATLGRMVILPRLADFVARFPGIELDIGLDDRMVDLVEGGYDLSIRTGRLEDSGLIARKLATHRFVLCASPDYLALHGCPETLDDLGNHVCIRFRYPSSGLLEKWAFDGREWDRELPTGPVFNDGEAVVLAAIAGLGIAQIPDYAAASARMDGRLIPILIQHDCVRGDIWLVRPAARANLPRVEALASFLKDMIPGAFSPDRHPIPAADQRER
jgi:DNA-binding transcriptional LysR family regulator